jgi:hypothetical protein
VAKNETKTTKVTDSTGIQVVGESSASDDGKTNTVMNLNALPEIAAQAKHG